MQQIKKKYLQKILLFYFLKYLKDGSFLYSRKVIVNPMNHLIAHNHFDKLPLELTDFIHNINHNVLMKGVCEELNTLVRHNNGLPLFTTLSYEGFRPFDRSLSGAREVAVYMGYCWHPYLIRKQEQAMKQVIQIHMGDSYSISNSSSSDGYNSSEMYDDHDLWDI